MLSNQREDLIDSGFDVAIRLGTPEPSALIARPLENYALTVCASPAYLKRTWNTTTAWLLPIRRAMTGGRWKNNGA